MIKPYLLVFFALVMLGGSCDNEADKSITGKSFSDCVVSFGQNKNFEVVTFNIKNFPRKNNTIMHTAEFLGHLNADVIALQEISNEGALIELADKMDGWEYVFTTEPSYNISLGYLIKMTEVELLEDDTRVLFEDDDWRFPRAPLVVKVKHRASGVETILVNLHLKAMGDDESKRRRRLASQKLKEYLDARHPDDFVIVLGDYNDELDEDNPIDDVFSNFADDSANYRFADMSVARAGEEYWSYPDWPSHLDHILITDEWFEYHDTTWTVRPDECFNYYEDYISDHRPVVTVFDLD